MQVRERRFNCPMTDDLCADGDCSITFCRAKNDARSIAIENDSETSIDRQVALAEAKRSAAIDALESKGIAPTEELIRRLIDHPAVVSEAERRVRRDEEFVRSFKKEPH